MNGVTLSPNGVPSRWEDLRSWAIVSDGRRDWLGNPHPMFIGTADALGRMTDVHESHTDRIVLRPAYELVDDDVWLDGMHAQGVDLRKGIPAKSLAARRRYAIPACHFGSAYEVEVLAVSVVRLSQISDVDLEMAFRAYVLPAEMLREAITATYRRAMSGIVLAGAMPKGGPG